MFRINSILCFITFFIWLSIGCQKPNGLTSENQAESEKIKPVEVTRVEKGNIQSDLEFSGSITANSRVVVMSQMMGKIIEIRVNEGQTVAKGDIIAVIESDELELRLRQTHGTTRSRLTSLVF